MVRSAEAIKHAFDEYFASHHLSLPIECLRRSARAFEQNGREIQYRFGADDGNEFLECYATNRMTNGGLAQLGHIKPYECREYATGTGDG